MISQVGKWALVIIWHDAVNFKITKLKNTLRIFGSTKYIKHSTSGLCCAIKKK